MKIIYLVFFTLVSFSSFSQAVTIVNRPEMKDELYEELKPNSLDLSKTKGFMLYSVNISARGAKKIKKRIFENFPTWFEGTPFTAFVHNPEQPYIEDGFFYMFIDALELDISNATITITIKDKEFKTLYSVRARNTSVQDVLAKMGITTY
jgi:hypothetical protein